MSPPIPNSLLVAEPKGVHQEDTVTWVAPFLIPEMGMKLTFEVRGHSAGEAWKAIRRQMVTALERGGVKVEVLR
jgi:hypothetical protein